jgi:hypothetical protein
MCEYCNGKEVEYQCTNTTKLFISTFGNATVLITESNHCPPYSDCCMKNIPDRSAFIIDYCPNCGRKLKK